MEKQKSRAPSLNNPLTEDKLFSESIIDKFSERSEEDSNQVIVKSSGFSLDKVCQEPSIEKQPYLPHALTSLVTFSEPP